MLAFDVLSVLKLHGCVLNENFVWCGRAQNGLLHKKAVLTAMAGWLSQDVEETESGSSRKSTFIQSRLFQCHRVCGRAQNGLFHGLRTKGQKEALQHSMQHKISHSFLLVIGNFLMAHCHNFLKFGNACLFSLTCQKVFCFSCD